MTENDGKDEMLSEEEMFRLLLYEDDEVKDKGRELYLDEVLKLMRKDLGTDTTSKDPDKES